MTTTRTIRFYKYSATGNDFIAIDNREGIVAKEETSLWQKLCSRRSGIGADGVLLLESSQNTDFSMIYLNCDGSIGEMCGNGARSIVAFAKLLEIAPSIQNHFSFSTALGIYSGQILKDTTVRVEMTELYDIDTICLDDLSEGGESLYLNTGVAHAVFQVENLGSTDVVGRGKVIRHDSRFEKGTNVNFFEVLGINHISLRTYERGVEDETLACGTGATAAAITAQQLLGMGDVVTVEMPGGTLTISEVEGKRYLTGEVKMIYNGTIEV